MPDNSIPLTLTSPPYDNLRTYNGNSSFEFEAIAQELYRVTVKGGVVVWVVGDATIKGSETGTSFKQALYFKGLGFRLHDTMIYRKKNPPPQYNKRYEQQFEYMFIFSKSAPKTFNPIKMPSKKIEGGSFYFQPDGTKKKANSPPTLKTEKNRYNIWDYPVGCERNGHPAVFPLQLALDHIQSWSNPGDAVLDPFMGSGTTGVAAQQLGREFIGIEVVKEYFDIAKKRLLDGCSINPCLLNKL